MSPSLSAAYLSFEDGVVNSNIELFGSHRNKAWYREHSPWFERGRNFCNSFQQEEWKKEYFLETRE